MKRFFSVLLLVITGAAFSQESEMAFIESRGNINLKIQAVDSLFDTYHEIDLVKASALAKKFLELSNESESKVDRIKALQAMSLVAGYQGDYSGSILYGKEGLELAITEKDSALMLVGYINQGDNYLELGRFDQAYFFTYKAHEIALKNKSLIDQTFTIHNFGRIYKELGQYDLAIENFKKADSISNILKDTQSNFYTAWEMGNLYHRQGKFDLAYANLKKAVNLASRVGVRVLQPDVQLDLARYYTDYNRLDEAKAYYDSALVLFRSFRNNLGEAEAGLGYGRIFLRKGLLKEAGEKFSEVLATAEGLNARSLQISALEELSKLEETRGDFRKSLNYFKRYNSLHDSLFSRELLDQTFKYQLQFLVDTKDNEIDALNQVNELRQAEISRQHLLRNIIIVVFLITIGLLYLVYRSNRRKQQLNSLLIAHQSELERRSHELEELNKLKDKFFSIISHDLRSPINSLAGVLNLMEKNGVSAQELPDLTRELRMQFNHTKNLMTNLLNW
ncbi:MAG: tetratricopeptide repeat protein, partial [Cyclobacteriaceae bacterium]